MIQTLRIIVLESVSQSSSAARLKSGPKGNYRIVCESRVNLAGFVRGSSWITEVIKTIFDIWIMGVVLDALAGLPRMFPTVEIEIV